MLHVNPEQLLTRLGISYVTKGEQLWASCPHPEHNDKTPSWRVIADPEHSKYTQHRCYGCGWGGWPVHLVETLLQCSRSEAVEWLRDIEKDPPLPFAVEVSYQRSLGTSFRMPPGVVVAPLSQWPAEPKACLLGRGITPAQVDRWQIGYAAGSWDPENNPLAHRIVFPVHNVAGRLIGYTGRSYDPETKRRYKEPSKAEGADLGAVFGERYWPKRRKIVCVVEGAIDGLAAERMLPDVPFGAIYGSQLHQGHIGRLSTFQSVIMATDNDKAGNRVALELEEELKRWVEVIRIELPEGVDVADMAARDPDSLRGKLRDAARVLSGDWDRCEVQARPAGRRRRTEVRARRVRR